MRREPNGPAWPNAGIAAAAVNVANVMREDDDGQFRSIRELLPGAAFAEKG